MDEPIVITLPLNAEGVVFLKTVLFYLLCSLPLDSDRKDVIDNFCLQCGSLNVKCYCSKDC